MSKPTPQQRHEAAAKGAQTAHRNRERRAEREATVRALREIMDNVEATPADRLRAIEMLVEMEK